MEAQLELDQKLYPAKDPQLPRRQEGSAGEQVGQMPGNRADGVLPGSRSQSIRDSRFRLSHAHAARGEAPAPVRRQRVREDRAARGAGRSSGFSRRTQIYRPAKGSAAEE